MVAATRLDCVLGSTALMRHTLNEAAWHVAHRSAFGGLLADKPLMQNVLADLQVETEAATALAIRLAAAVDAADDPHEAALRRIALPLAKFWVCKRTPGFVAEALECLGGNGYVEESGLPLRYREAPLNSVWEGSGNVNALDVLRALGREPEVLSAWITRGRPRPWRRRAPRPSDRRHARAARRDRGRRGRRASARRPDGGLSPGRAARPVRPAGGGRRVLRLAPRHDVRRHLRDADLAGVRPPCDRRTSHPDGGLTRKGSTMNDVVPMLTYADGPAAMDWLVAAFGFEEQTRWLDDDGRVAHGELRAGDGLVMVASTNADYEGPDRPPRALLAGRRLAALAVRRGRSAGVRRRHRRPLRPRGRRRRADPVADRGRRSRPAVPHRGPRGSPLDVPPTLLAQSGSSPRASSLEHLAEHAVAIGPDPLGPCLLDGQVALADRREHPVCLRRTPDHAHPAIVRVARSTRRWPDSASWVTN